MYLSCSSRDNSSEAEANQHPESSSAESDSQESSSGREQQSTQCKKSKPKIKLDSSIKYLSSSSDNYSSPEGKKGV